MPKAKPVIAGGKYVAFGAGHQSEIRKFGFSPKFRKAESHNSVTVSI